MSAILPLPAFILDLLFKDPPHWPHPVRWIGSCLDFLERLCLRQKVLSLKQSGVIALGLLIILVFVLLALLTALPYLGYILALYFAYSGLALGGLLQSAGQVIGNLEMDNLKLARVELGFLVSRDTSSMTREDIYKTLAETVGENFNDGFVAPMFYLCLGGPILLWVYKAVSTMDSMWGYKYDHYQDLGWAGARLDDVLAWIPARLSAGLILLVASFYGLNWKKTWQNIRQQARRMDSPNAGWPMAAAAWSAGAQMGGWYVYQGQRVQKASLGPSGFVWSMHKLRRLLRLLLLAGWLTTFVGQIWAWFWFG